MLGIPFDGGASFRAGQSLAPPSIRSGLYSESTNLCAENGIDLSTHPGWRDIGDLEIASQPLTGIEGEISQILNAGHRILSLGGDHSITLPILRAYSKPYPNLVLLQIDAHSDLYDEFDGKRFSHASPFARIMEEQLIDNLVQVGIRTLTPHQRQQAERFGVEIHEMRDWNPDNPFDTMDGKNVYLSLDLDVLDPAYAPGISHHEPGGMTTRDVIQIIQNLQGNLVGADLVEYNPERDFEGITAMVAAKFIKEILVQMLK
jgi:agmatinase